MFFVPVPSVRGWFIFCLAARSASGGAANGRRRAVALAGSFVLVTLPADPALRAGPESAAHGRRRAVALAGSFL